MPPIGGVFEDKKKARKKENKKDKKEGWQIGLKADISNFENFLLPEFWQKVQSISPSIMYIPVVKWVPNPHKNESGQPENIFGTSSIVPFFMIFD